MATRSRIENTIVKEDKPRSKKCEQVKAKPGVGGSKSCVTHEIRANQFFDETYPSASIVISDPKELLKLAKDNPLNAASECQRAAATLKSGFNDRTYDLIAVAYAVSRSLSHDNKKWKLFCKEPFWGQFKQRAKNNKSYHNKLTKFVYKYAFGATTPAETNRTNCYVKILEKCYHQGLPAEEVADLIRKSGGIEEMRRRGVAERKAKKNLQTKNDVDDKDLRELLNEDEITELNANAGSTTARKAAIKIARKRAKERILAKELEKFNVLFRKNFLSNLPHLYKFSDF